MECVLGTTGEACKGESWTVVNIAHNQSRILRIMQTPFAMWLCFHFLEVSLISTGASGWFCSISFSMCCTAFLFDSRSRSIICTMGGIKLSRSLVSSYVSRMRSTKYPKLFATIRQPTSNLPKEPSPVCGLARSLEVY